MRPDWRDRDRVGKRAVSDTEVLDHGGETTLSRLMDAHGLHLLAAVAKRGPGVLTVVLGFVVAMSDARARAQAPALPSMPKAAQAAPEPTTGKAVTAPTVDNPEATVAETAGPITVAETVSDDALRRKLEKLLPKYPGVRKVGVEVEEGVVTLTGHVADSEVRDRLRDFIRRVQGVNLVLNQTKTDAQMLTARDYAIKQIREYWDIISRKWLLALFALGLVLASSTLARLFKRSSETLLMPFTGNILLRSVLGSVIAGLIIIGGVLSALKMLGLTEAVLSFLGLAGVVALAVGFAFRDIAENFIASVMLGMRRPFRAGDYIEVAGQSGVVRSLNTRATVLVTFDGSQVRIPNATIFKETLVNKTASTSIRRSFDVLVSYDVSIASATAAISQALSEHEGFADEPPPRTLVESLEPGGVRIRSYFWFPAKGVDGLKLLSDAQLAAKVALQRVGITPAPAPATMLVPGEVLAELRRSHSGASLGADTPAMTSEQAQANLQRDAEAADIASARAPEEQENAIEHALDVAIDGVSEEGKNLIGDK